MSAAAETLIAGFKLDDDDAEPLAREVAAILRRPELAAHAANDLKTLTDAGHPPCPADREEYLATFALGWFIGHVRHHPDEGGAFLFRARPVRDVVARILARARAS